MAKQTKEPEPVEADEPEDAAGREDASDASVESEDASDGGQGAEEVDGEPVSDREGGSGKPTKRSRKVRAAERGDEHLDDGTPATLGATKYVHAAFFAFGILVAFLAGKLLGSIWNSLAEWPPAVRAVPQLLSYSEEERPTLTMAVGAVVGLIAVVQSYRKEQVRTWASEVALELSKVTWPGKELVTNGTIVVCIATVVAAVYVSLLDRFWGFVTQLVYGV